jgi:hypothetical protein
LTAGFAGNKKMTINRGAYKKIPQVQIQDAIIDVIDIWLRFASAHSDTAAMGDFMVEPVYRENVVPFLNEFEGAASMNHYHIRWAESEIDWQAFQTKNEAVAEAERLKRWNEKYSIEERDGGCERCQWLNPNTRIVER